MALSNFKQKQQDYGHFEEQNASSGPARFSNAQNTP
jgi:hypothetical protein